VDPTQVLPEPATFVLLGPGLAGLRVSRRKQYPNSGHGKPRSGGAFSLPVSKYAQRPTDNRLVRQPVFAFAR
jgi:hypothetical protein